MNEKIDIVLFDEEELTKTLVQSYLKEVSFPFDIMDLDFADMNFIPTSGNKKSIIIVNINKTNTSVLDKVAKLSQHKNNLFILVSYDKSADLQVQAMRAGAKEFLCKPLIQSDFVYVINKIYKNDVIGVSKNDEAIVYSSISIDEHVGKTFFTFNLAKELADMSREKVLYLDFNNNLKDIYTVLGMNADYNTPYYVNKIDENNAESLFERAPKYKKSSLSIIGNGVFRNAETVVQIDKLDSFFNIAKKYFKYILIDNEDTSSLTTTYAMRNSNKIYLIAEPSVIMASKIKRFLDINLSKRAVRIVLNKFSAGKEDQILNQMEEKIERQIFAKIPKNFVATSASMSKGISLKELSPELDVVKTYTKLANYMINRDKQ